MLLRKQCNNSGSLKNLIRSHPFRKLIAWLSGEELAAPHELEELLLRYKSLCIRYIQQDEEPLGHLNPMDVPWEQVKRSSWRQFKGLSSQTSRKDRGCSQHSPITNMGGLWQQSELVFATSLMPVRGSAAGNPDWEGREACRKNGWNNT